MNRIYTSIAAGVLVLGGGVAVMAVVDRPEPTAVGHNANGAADCHGWSVHFSQYGSDGPGPGGSWAYSYSADGATVAGSLGGQFPSGLDDSGTWDPTLSHHLAWTSQFPGTTGSIDTQPCEQPTTTTACEDTTTTMQETTTTQKATTTTERATTTTAATTTTTPSTTPPTEAPTTTTPKTTPPSSAPTTTAPRTTPPTTSPPAPTTTSPAPRPATTTTVAAPPATTIPVSGLPVTC